MKETVKEVLIEDIYAGFNDLSHTAKMGLRREW